MFFFLRLLHYEIISLCRIHRIIVKKPKLKVESCLLHVQKYFRLSMQRSPKQESWLRWKSRGGDFSKHATQLWLITALSQIITRAKLHLVTSHSGQNSWWSVHLNLPKSNSNRSLIQSTLLSIWLEKLLSKLFSKYCLKGCLVRVIWLYLIWFESFC